MIGAALNGYQLAEVPTTMRDRAVHAGPTKKGGNLLYGLRFARVVARVWWRDRGVRRRHPRARRRVGARVVSAGPINGSNRAHQ
jgi:hypothetical protein